MNQKIEGISNYKIYNERMKKGLNDKLFFTELIDDFESFVDFGCANGDIIDAMHLKVPHLNYYGIDNDEKMLELLKEKCPYAFINSNISDLNINTENALINFSSVVHEIFYYMKKEDIEQFWNDVFNKNFKYIVVRDIMCDESINRPADIDDVNKVLKFGNSKQIEDFINIYGSLDNLKNLTHFLLKYRYIENWERELRENYFATNIDDFLKIVPNNYEVIYLDRYILPYTKDRIKKDFGINLKDNTHVKIILKRK